MEKYPPIPPLEWDAVLGEVAEPLLEALELGIITEIEALEFLEAYLGPGA